MIIYKETRQQSLDFHAQLLTPFRSKLVISYFTKSCHCILKCFPLITSFQVRQSKIIYTLLLFISVFLCLCWRLIKCCFSDFHPASLTVSPDRVQHFSSETVSLSCEGNSAEWRVMRFSDAGHLSNCSVWGAVTGSTCTIHKHKNKTAVYWCESGSRQFSNAVNITAQSNYIFASVFLIFAITLWDFTCYIQITSPIQ